MIKKLVVEKMKQVQINEHLIKQAGGYEKLIVKLIPEYRKQHQIIETLLPKENKNYRVLDLGCGNGILSELIFKNLPNSYIVDFDLNVSMLDACEKKLSNYSGKFELKQGDFRTTSIGDEYDIIIASLTLHHLTWVEREKLYKSLYFSLNDGGLFIARDIIIDENNDVAKEQYGHWKEFIKSQGEDPDYWYSKHIEKIFPMTITEHFAWLRNAGFSKMACQWRLYNFAITTAEKENLEV